MRTYVHKSAWRAQTLAAVCCASLGKEEKRVTITVMGKLLSLSPELLFMVLFYNLLGHKGLVETPFFSLCSIVASLHSTELNASVPLTSLCTWSEGCFYLDLLISL